MNRRPGRARGSLAGARTLLKGKGKGKGKTEPEPELVEGVGGSA